MSAPGDRAPASDEVDRAPASDEVDRAPLALPDVPRWVEAHGIAADPASWRRALGGGLAVGSDAARLIVVAGDADPAAVTALAYHRPHHTMLIAIEREDLARLTGRQVVRALLHVPERCVERARRDDGAAHEGDAGALDALELLDLAGAVALPSDVSLAHLPAPLAAELAQVRPHRTIWTVFVDGEPVSFAYAPWRSARWFDVSVDTVGPARQLGLGRIVAAAMIHDERAHGREPVWAADEANAGSLRLAHSLGFVEVDALWVAT